MTDVSFQAEMKRIVPHGTLLPPARPGVRHVSVPMVGVVIADDELRDRVDRWFYWPMIILALALLPLLAWELLAPPVSFTWQWWASAASIAVVWTAFFVEFMIKVAIAECRIEYCKSNWLDILVLALPALRPLRVAVLARTSRVFTLRGVGMKLLKYGVTIVVGLEATDRMLARFGLKSMDERSDPTRMTRHRLMKEVRKLRRLSDRWEAWYRAEQAYLADRGVKKFPRPEPQPSVDLIETPRRTVDSESHSRTVETTSRNAEPLPNGAGNGLA